MVISVFFAMEDGHGEEKAKRTEEEEETSVGMNCTPILRAFCRALLGGGRISRRRIHAGSSPLSNNCVVIQPPRKPPCCS